MTSNLPYGNRQLEIGKLVDRVDIIGEAIAIGQHQPSIVAKVCGICTSVENPTDMCPILQETKSDHPESVRAIGGY
ncbi:hypothetical protein CR513_18830, partial [Mucuna pruriens]